MRVQFVVIALGFLFSLTGNAAQRSFTVFSSKQITPKVERFYGQDGNAFATMFCNPESPQVMIVDSRLTDLDGKTFLFGSLQACEKGRADARNSLNKCLVELVIDTTTQAAVVKVSRCK
ncbi:hypothetical protein [Bdellovibrio sp. BCCA]|uniref:hypothetical protein n=1 Tax=Bdellovibrio sp. BCCA TaxID=3136281 RepID=UPI0030F335B1